MKRWSVIALVLALWCTATAAQARSLKDYRLEGAQGYARCAPLADGGWMLASSGMENETRLSRRAQDGSERYTISVPLMGTQRGTMSAVLPDGRYAAAFRVDENRDEVRLFDENGEAGVFALPEGADYLRMEPWGISLLYRDAREVKLLDYAGNETQTLSLPGERLPISMEVLPGREVIYAIARTQAQEDEAVMGAPYALYTYDTSGALCGERLLYEEELGFYLYGDKCVDAQDGLVMVGADQTDYKKAHVLRLDASGEETFHRVVSDENGAVVSIEYALTDEAGVLLGGTVVAQSRGLFTCMLLRMDSAGKLVDSDIRAFDMTNDYLYGLGIAPDGMSYVLKGEAEEQGIDFKWLSIVPFADLSATDKARLTIE